MKNFIEGIPNENEVTENTPENVVQLYKTQILRLNTVKNFEYGHFPLVERGFEMAKYIKQLNKATN